MKTTFRSLPIGLVLLLAGCSTAYYGAMEKIGVAKRAILADRVEKARDAQTEARQQFADALHHFLAVTKADGGDLQKKYNALNREYQRSEARAKEVRERIAAVENVADALFREWKQELAQYSNPTLHAVSQRQLEATRRRYDTTIGLMRRSTDRMDPVVAMFKDQVLSLKPNLNSNALARLDAANRTLAANITRLIAEKDVSIREAEAFIRLLKTTPEDRIA